MGTIPVKGIAGQNHHGPGMSGARTPRPRRAGTVASMTRIFRHDLGVSWVRGEAMGRGSPALRDEAGGVGLVAPPRDGGALGAAAEMGTPAAVLQLLDRHSRDCAAIAGALEVPH